MADFVFHSPQFGSQLAYTLTGPAQRGFRVAARRRFQQSLQVGPQGHVFDHGSLAASAFPAHATSSQAGIVQSVMPWRITGREIPVALATRDIPPLPIA